MNAMNKKRGLAGMVAVLFLGLAVLLLSACSDEMEVQQSYPFKVENMPVPTRIVKGETVEIRCELKREGHFSDARYTIRYFQPDGKGTLRMDDGMVLLPNDRYPLDREVFRLYYTSECEDQQTIDIYFEDNSEPAQLYQLTFDFNNETEDEDSVVTADSKELPVTITKPVLPMMKLKAIWFAVLSATIFFPGMPSRAENPVKASPDRFSLAVECVKRFEGWHGEKKHWPYVGWGHKVLPGERFTNSISKAQGDSILREDLRKLCRMFSYLGRDSLLLSEISDNRYYPNPSIILKIQFFIL